MRNYFDGKFTVHFIGIGGIGMSAIAFYLKNLGFIVSGSDRQASETTDKLEASGIHVHIGHDEKNVYNKEVVVYSSAITETNVELLYAIKSGAAVFSRAEALSLISARFSHRIEVSGAHGKTTSTALISHILYAAGMRFTAFIGGYDKTFSNTSNFGNDIFVAEICEYKKNIDKFTTDTAVMLNVDNDHLDCFGDFTDLVSSFEGFYSRAKRRVVNTEDNVLSSFTGNKETFGLTNGDYRAKRIRAGSKGLRFTVVKNGKKYLKVKTSLIGKYNAYNVLAAIAATDDLGIPKKAIRNGLKKFSGIKRRDEFIGKLNGARFFADYAHHPEEIKRSIEKYKMIASGRVFVVFQPHTYSRTRLLFKEFVSALSGEDDLFIFKEYAAREHFDRYGSAKRLSDAIPTARYYCNPNNLMRELSAEVGKRDMVVILGAGDLYDVIKVYLNEKCRK